MGYDINDKKMSRLAQDPEAVRRLAASILENFMDELPAAAVRFLEELSGYTGDPLLSVRQREWLSDLQVYGSRYASAGGVAAATLVREAFCLRRDLSDDVDAEPFLVGLMTRAKPGRPLTLTEREWKKLLVICGLLGLERPDYIVFPNERPASAADRLRARAFAPQPVQPEETLVHIPAGTQLFQAFVDRVRAVDPAHADVIVRERTAVKVRHSEFSELVGVASAT